MVWRRKRARQQFTSSAESVGATCFSRQKGPVFGQKWHRKAPEDMVTSRSRPFRLPNIYAGRGTDPVRPFPAGNRRLVIVAGDGQDWPEPFNGRPPLPISGNRAIRLAQRSARWRFVHQP